jgi:hypothetical protein
MVLVSVVPDAEKKKASAYNQGGGRVGALMPPPAKCNDLIRSMQTERRMSPFNIEDQIKKAQESGEFDHLRGKGKPFTHLDTDPLKHLVQEQGIGPHWLELDHEIQAKIEIARQSVKRTYEWVMQTWSSGSSDRRYARDEWRTAQRIFEQRLAEINRLIQTFNLELPEPLRHKQRFPLKKEDELKRLGLAATLD